MTLAVTFVVCSATVAMGLAIARLVIGPTEADRIVALDIVFSSSVAMTLAAAMASGRALYLDVGIGLALVGFVATLVWARLIYRSPRRLR